MSAWRCGHPRTIENAWGGRLRYGCRTCRSKQRHENYYASIGVARKDIPVPVAYRRAIAGGLPKYAAANNKNIGTRVVAILNACEMSDRVSYMMRRLYDKPAAQIAAILNTGPEDVERRADAVAAVIAQSEHQNYYKDWTLVQELIDEGVAEVDVKEMIGITNEAWNYAKRRGAVRV